jgi:8-oxo-dGTP diphosphatase
MRDIVDALFVRDGSVLLARRNAHRSTYPGLWSFSGGHVEPGETLIEALVREVREEVGITQTSFSFAVMIVDPNASETDPATYYLYVVAAWDGGEPALVGDEHTELRWFKLDDAFELVDLALDEYRPVFRDMISRRHPEGDPRLNRDI